MDYPIEPSRYWDDGEKVTHKRCIDILTDLLQQKRSEEYPCLYADPRDIVTLESTDEHGRITLQHTTYSGIIREGIYSYEVDYANRSAKLIKEIEPNNPYHIKVVVTNVQKEY